MISNNVHLPDPEIDSELTNHIAQSMGKLSAELNTPDDWTELPENSKEKTKAWCRVFVKLLLPSDSDLASSLLSSLPKNSQLKNLELSSHLFFKQLLTAEEFAAELTRDRVDKSSLTKACFTVITSQNFIDGSIRELCERLLGTQFRENAEIASEALLMAEKLLRNGSGHFVSNVTLDIWLRESRSIYCSKATSFDTNLRFNSARLYAQIGLSDPQKAARLDYVLGIEKMAANASPEVRDAVLPLRRRP